MLFEDYEETQQYLYLIRTQRIFYRPTLFMLALNNLLSELQVSEDKRFKKFLSPVFIHLDKFFI